MNASELTHLQPSYPPMPSNFAMPYARRPENAPPVAAEVYRRAMRVCVSFGRYHLEMRRIAPGKNPALETGVSSKGSSVTN